LAAGNPGKAAAALGIGEALIRRGSGTTARAIQEGAKVAPAIAPAALNVGKNIFQKKPLTEEKALEFLDQAGDDIEKAKELARRAGYEVP